MEQTRVSEAGMERPVQPFVRAELGDARTIMATLPADSVDCCITSPPYWGLRDYGLEPLSWGGSPSCAHRWEADRCAPCGAWLGSLGLEPTVELFVAHIVEVFRAVRRVLKPTGTVWLNLGDCYNSGTTAARVPSPSKAHHGYWRTGGEMGDRRVRAAGLKVKDLVGVPWRVALALQADGWYLRSDIIWAKPNPLPEGVTDRPTRAHEYLFLLSKGSRYFYDAQAIREPAAGSASEKQSDTRARRSVWTIATRPYRQAHFATYPERLVELCLLAGTSAAGRCVGCGAPWVRESRVTYRNPGLRASNGPRSVSRRHESPGFPLRLERDCSTTRWQPTCGCALEPRPAIVLDPFAGSGTTLAVAQVCGRSAIGIEVKPAYLELIQERLARHSGRQPLPADHLQQSMLGAIGTATGVTAAVAA